MPYMSYVVNLDEREQSRLAELQKELETLTGWQYETTDIIKTAIAWASMCFCQRGLTDVQMGVVRYAFLAGAYMWREYTGRPSNERPAAE